MRFYMLFCQPQERVAILVAYTPLSIPSSPLPHVVPDPLPSLPRSPIPFPNHLPASSLVMSDPITAHGIVRRDQDRRAQSQGKAVRKARMSCYSSFVHMCTSWTVISPMKRGIGRPNQAEGPVFVGSEGTGLSASVLYTHTMPSCLSSGRLASSTGGSSFPGMTFEVRKG